MKRATQSTGQKAGNANSVLKRPKAWCWLFLLPLALFLPLVGEFVQQLLIGPEHVCCMPDNIKFLTARAEIARHLRWLSNLLIGGSMLAGIALVIFALIKLRRLAFLQIVNPVLRYVIVMAVALVAVYIIVILVGMFCYLVAYNNGYFYYLPYPGGGLYECLWFNPTYYWQILISPGF